MNRVVATYLDTELMRADMVRDDEGQEVVRVEGEHAVTTHLLHTNRQPKGDVFAVEHIVDKGIYFSLRIEDIDSRVIRHGLVNLRLSTAEKQPPLAILMLGDLAIGYEAQAIAQNAVSMACMGASIYARRLLLPNAPGFEYHEQSVARRTN